MHAVTVITAIIILPLTLTSRSISHDLLKFNTLQAVLATDHVQTVAVFIYDNIEWGERAQIGFNAGDGHAFFKLPGALSDETINMDEKSNVGEPGVFVYRIDSKYIRLYIIIIIIITSCCS